MSSAKLRQGAVQRAMSLRNMAASAIGSLTSKLTLTQHAQGAATPTASAPAQNESNSKSPNRASSPLLAAGQTEKVASDPLVVVDLTRPINGWQSLHSSLLGEVLAYLGPHVETPEEADKFAASDAAENETPDLNRPCNCEAADKRRAKHERDYTRWLLMLQTTSRAFRSAVRSQRCWAHLHLEFHGSEAIQKFETAHAQSLHHMPLQHLHLTHCTPTLDLMRLVAASYPHLREFSLNDALSDADFDAKKLLGVEAMQCLARLPQLETLHLTDCFSLARECFDELHTLQSLSTLSLSYTSECGEHGLHADLSCMRQGSLPDRLNCFVLDYDAVDEFTDEACRSIAQLKHLSVLELQIGATSLHRFLSSPPSLPLLQQLTLVGEVADDSTLTDEQMDASLTALSLRSVEASDLIAAWSQLRTCSLAMLDSSDAKYAPKVKDWMLFSKLSHLTHLELDFPTKMSQFTSTQLQRETESRCPIISTASEPQSAETRSSSKSLVTHMAVRVGTEALDQQWKLMLQCFPLLQELCVTSVPDANVELPLVAALQVFPHKHHVTIRLEDEQDFKQEEPITIGQTTITIERGYDEAHHNHTLEAVELELEGEDLSENEDAEGDEPAPGMQD